MQREPFPKPGEHLVDQTSTESIHESRPPSPISIVGRIGYGQAHPSRWAGRGSREISRLTVENEAILIKPFRFWRIVTRLPIVRIPLTEITSASKMTWGLWFHVHGSPELDGTRFIPLASDRASLKPLVELLQARGIPMDRMPVSTRVKKSFENSAVAMRPGLFLRDRGLLGWVESIVITGVSLTLIYFYFFGGFSHTSVVIRALFVFVIVLSVLAWIVGARLRRKALAVYRPSKRR